MQTQQRKRQIVQNWLSSFVVTTVVAVAVILSPKPPVANFLELESVGTDIYYQVQIENQDENFNAQSLKIVAKSPLDTQQQTLQFGQTEGSFSALLPNTEYVVSVLTSSGFGDFSLAKQTVKTTTPYGGRIVSAELIEDEYQESFLCSVSVAYSDYKNMFQEVYVSAVYHFTEHYQEQPQEVAIDFEDQIVLENQFSFTLHNIPRINGYLTLTLNALLQDEQVLVLQEKTIYSPFIVQAYAYLSFVGETSVEGAVYPDMALDGATYFAILKQNEQIVSQQIIEIIADEYQYFEMGTVIFENLDRNTDYVLEFYIRVVNPTSEIEIEQLFQSVEFVTTEFIPS